MLMCGSVRCAFAATTLSIRAVFVNKIGNQIGLSTEIFKFIGFE